MDFSKINKIDQTGDGNIILQDIRGSTVTINYNDTEALKKILSDLSDAQTFKLKELIGKQYLDVLTEIRKIQEQLDQKNTNQKAEEVAGTLDDFFKEINAIRIEGAKNRLITNYKLLREYEELLILEEDPKRKMKYNMEIETIKGNIAREESELTNIAKIK